MAKLDERLAKMTPLQRAMFALKETQDRLEALQRRLSEPIAIVGMACRFPGEVTDPRSYWRLLCDGVDAIRQTPPDRWDADAWYDPDPAAPGKMNTRWGGYLDRIDEFDNHFFGISDREAARLDPQHRLMLELGWEALEDAGLPPSRLRGTKVGVFVGISLSDYAVLLTSDVSQTDAYVAAGTSLCLAANRLSFCLGFQGPSLVLDTACSSSLVAVHLACQSIRQGECEAALAGGTSLLLSPIGTVNLTKAGFCASDGRVRAFDAAASGYVRGDGAGLVALKPLSAALRDQDPIYAVIRGSAVNQNGTSNGMTAPSRPAQEQVLREAYQRAGVSPGQVQYVETQGTGTRLGDAIEALALGRVLAEGRRAGSRCAIGSVKTNFGHLEAAAGIASLMKAALAVQQAQRPPSLHFRTPNPDIPFDQLPLEVQQRLASWPAADHPRLAGVSALGFGGSNAHVVLEQAPAAPQTTADRKTQRPALLPLSARTERARLALAERYLQFLQGDPPAWSDVCFTAARRRDHHDCRLILLADSNAEAATLLEQYVAGSPHSDRPGNVGWLSEPAKVGSESQPTDVFCGRKPYGRDLRVALLYGDRTDGWNPYLTRLSELASAVPATVQQLDAAWSRAVGGELARIWQEAATWADPATAGPALVAGQLLLTAWWRSVGLTPALVAGQGWGELAAACTAGILSADDALRLAAAVRANSPDEVQTKPASLPFVSLRDGQRHAGPDLGPAHWQACRQPMAVPADVWQSLRSSDVDGYLELGPASLTAACGDSDAGADGDRFALASFRGPAGEQTALMRTVARLYAAGVDLAWERLAPADGRCVRLPTYPWQRQRLWALRKSWANLGPDAAIGPGELSAVQPLAGEHGVPSAGEQRRPRPDLTSPYVAPRTETERILAQAWSELLGIDGIGIHDSFLQLGGHSLLAAQAMSRIGQQFHVALPLRELFETPTIAALATAIEAAQRDAGASAFHAIVPIPRDGELPLSLNQEALWFLDRLEPDRPTYMLYLALNVRGPLNVPALERALREIGHRHEVLRTTFPERDGAPVQEIAPEVPDSAMAIDLSHLPAPEREGELRRRIAEEMGKPIDLQRGPLVRIALFRRGENDYAAVACTHHIIHDGWSMGVLLGELGILYPAFAAGRTVQLPELPIQYVDFAAWHRQWLRGERLERLRSYWREQLAGVPPLELPTDFPRPSIRTTRGSTRPCVLSPETSTAVRDFCGREGVTPFMVLLAAFQVLLNRYSGQDDFAVGVPVANRGRPETQALIGYFVNVVVLRANLTDDPSFRQIVARARQIGLDAFERQEMTLDQVVDAVKPARDLSRNPLFQVMFALQNLPLPQPPDVGLEITLLDDSPAPPSANFDLTLELFDRADGFQGGLNFSTDLFRPETIDRMVQQFQVLVAAAVGAPDQRISALPLLTEDQQRAIIVRGNDTAREYDRSRLVHHLFETHAAQQPDAIAVVLDEQRWSYGQLNERANQLAHYLQRQGVGPEVRVGTCLDRSPELIRAVLAVMKAGGAYVPLDPTHLRTAEERIQYVLQDAQVSLVLTDSALSSQLNLGDARRILVDGPAADEIARQGRENVAGAATADHLAYVLYTSGSTGRPKGVMVTQGNLLNAYYGWESAYRLADDVRSHLQMASFGFDVFAGDLVRALGSGGKLVLCRKEILLDAGRLSALIRREQIDGAEFVPLVLRNLVEYLQESRQTLDDIRLVIAGSDAWYAADHRSAQQVFGPRTRLVNSYGLTETTIDSTYFEGDVGELPDHAQVPIGRPFPNVRVYVLDSLRQPAPPGVAGELYIGGDGVARGYVNPQQDAERFVADRFADQPGGRLYRTGDRARWRADGQLEFLGRADQQVKIRGYRVEPGEIEQVLREHPAAAQAAVVARERTSGDLRLVAYTIGAGDVALDGGELREFLAQRLPEYMVPSAFFPLDDMPTTASGKIDRQRLPAPDWSLAGTACEFIAPQTAAERQLAGIWREILDVEQVGVGDDFFDLGGNSLLALRLVSRVRAAFSVELPLVTLFTAPRLGDLAARISALQHSGPVGEVLPFWINEMSTSGLPSFNGSRSLVPLRSGGSATPLFCLHGLGGHAVVFRPLAEALAAGRPVYGLQALGLDAGQTPHESVEIMAAHYVREVQAVQPHGPYLLSGWSLGGLTALEAARQLAAAGETVALVALLDSYLSLSDFAGRRLDEQAALRWLAPHLGLRVAEFKRLPLDRQWERIAEQAHSVHGIGLPEIRRLAAVCRAQLSAAAQYRPQPYAGPAVLFRAGSRRRFAERRWRSVCPQLHVEQVPGNHYSMLRQPQVAMLAQRLEDYLRQHQDQES
ncbi:MAG: amino acid adenylation domain-containing protein [Candidatus Anammoximicrobium sp.]|nr:amino acid adenylation domain-containing protein [Candidatus Anammoximicrobium sp.]